MRSLVTITIILFSISIIGVYWYGNVEPFKPLVGCESNEELNVICGFSNPEDLALTPDNEFFILSEYGGQKPIQEVLPGNLALFHIPSRTKKDFVIEFGNNNRLKNKTQNLKAFYNRAISKNEIDKYKKLNLQFENQVVAVK